MKFPIVCLEKLSEETIKKYSSNSKNIKTLDVRLPSPNTKPIIYTYIKIPNKTPNIKGEFISLSNIIDEVDNSNIKLVDCSNIKTETLNKNEEQLPIISSVFTIDDNAFRDSNEAFWPQQKSVSKPLKKANSILKPVKNRKSKSKPKIKFSSQEQNKLFCNKSQIESISISGMQVMETQVVKLTNNDSIIQFKDIADSTSEKKPDDIRHLLLTLSNGNKPQNKSVSEFQNYEEEQQNVRIVNNDMIQFEKIEKLHSFEEIKKAVDKIKKYCAIKCMTCGNSILLDGISNICDQECMKNSNHQLKYQCLRCCRVFLSSDDFYDHTRRCYNHYSVPLRAPVLRCNLCTYTTRTSDRLNEHIESRHSSSSSQTPIDCTINMKSNFIKNKNQSYQDILDVQKILLTNENQDIPDVQTILLTDADQDKLDKSISFSDSLKYCITFCPNCKIENGETLSLQKRIMCPYCEIQMKYKCSICNKILVSFRGHRDHYYNIHDKSFTWKCSKCKSEFNRKYSFIQHEKKCKLKKRKNPSKCAFCKRKFYLRRDLRLHLQKMHPQIVSVLNVDGLVAKMYQKAQKKKNSNNTAQQNVMKSNVMESNVRESNVTENSIKCKVMKTYVNRKALKTHKVKIENDIEIKTEKVLPDLNNEQISYQHQDLIMESHDFEVISENPHNEVFYQEIDDIENTIKFECDEIIIPDVIDDDDIIRL